MRHCLSAALAGAMTLAALCPAIPALAISDRRDFQAMYDALKDLMGFPAPGRSINWGNPETGGHGTITAVRRADQDGLVCWEYERTYNEGTDMRAISGVACELESGFWQILDRTGNRPVADSRPEPQAAPQVATKPAATAKRFDSYTVRQTQSLLFELGYDPGPVDGAYGGKTRTAIEQFERDKDYPVTGEPSPSLIARLREATDAVAARQPAPAAPSETPREPATAATDGPPPKMLLAEPPEPALGTGPAAAQVPPAAAQPAPSQGANSGLTPPPPPPPPPPAQ